MSTTDCTDEYFWLDYQINNGTQDSKLPNFTFFLFSFFFFFLVRKYFETSETIVCERLERRMSLLNLTNIWFLIVKTAFRLINLNIPVVKKKKKNLPFI